MSKLASFFGIELSELVATLDEMRDELGRIAKALADTRYASFTHSGQREKTDLLLYWNIRLCLLSLP